MTQPNPERSHPDMPTWAVSGAAFGGFVFHLAAFTAQGARRKYRRLVQSRIPWCYPELFRVDARPASLFP